MGIIESKVFRSGNSQAVRLPKEVAYDEEIEVIIEKLGDRLTIRPKKRKISPQEMVRRLRELPTPKRIAKRPPFIAPKRIDQR